MKMDQPETKIWNKELPLGRFLSLLTKTYFGALTKKLEHMDLERHYSFLIIIESKKEGCSQQYLCDYLGMDKASMVKHMDYLVDMGLVKRDENPVDRRGYLLNLTGKARAIMPEIHQAVNELNAEATKGLDAAQREQFYRSLELVYANLARQPSHKVIYNLKKVK